MNIIVKQADSDRLCIFNRLLSDNAATIEVPFCKSRFNDAAYWRHNQAQPMSRLDLPRHKGKAFKVIAQRLRCANQLGVAKSLTISCADRIGGEPDAASIK